MITSLTSLPGVSKVWSLNSLQSDPEMGSNPPVPRILAAETDLYVAAIDEKVIAKIGPREDKVAKLIPPNFQVFLSGDQYAVWEKKA